MSPWLVCQKRKTATLIRLFCFHHAGGSASAFRNWGSRLPTWIEVVAVQMPGREERFNEKCIDQFDVLIHSLMEALSPYLDKPFAVFGFSLGGLIGFEWIRALSRNGLKLPILFISAGRQAPHLSSDTNSIASLPEDEFVEELLKDYKKTLGPILEIAELRQCFLPQIRADFKLLETYDYDPGDKISCPILVFSGEDELDLGESEIWGWSEHTTCLFDSYRFPGDHFFIFTSEDLILIAIEHHLSVVLAS